MYIQTSDLHQDLDGNASAVSATRDRLETRVVRNVGALEASEGAEWDALMRESDQALLFCSRDWTQTWFDSFGKEKESWLLAVRDAGRLVGVVPLVLSRVWRLPTMIVRYDFQPEDPAFIQQRSRLPRMLPMRQLAPTVNLQSVNMRGGWLIARGFEEAVFEATFRFLNHAPKAWDVLLLPSVPQPYVETVSRVATAVGLQARVTPGIRTLYRLRVTPWEEYFAARSKHFRNRFRAVLRKFELLGGAKLETITSPSGLPAVLDEMARLARQSWKEAGREAQAVHLPLTPVADGFYRTLAARYAARNACQMVVARVTGGVIGCMLCVTEGKTLYALQTYYAPEYADVSVGRLLTYELIRWSAENGIDTIDFNGNSALVTATTKEADIYDQVQLFRRRGYSGLLHRYTSMIDRWMTRRAKPKQELKGEAAENAAE